jgi:hypothetical protein
MKASTLVPLLTLACSAFSLAAEKDASQLRDIPKNLARHHVGANLFLYSPATGSFQPTEASAAWLDDDITTGWPILAGRQHYMMALPTAELMNNFSVSARPAEGTVTLYAGDEPAAPGAKSWSVIARDVPFEAINQKLSKPFSRVAKYLLIETNSADPGPVYSVYLYGDKPAVAYDLQKRSQPLDPRAIFGPHVNERTTLNVSGLYADSRVSQAGGDSAGFASWQKAIDDNPESALRLAPASGQEASATIRYNEPRAISRVALLADAGATGKLDFYATSRPAAEAGTTTTEAEPTGIAGLTPVGSVTLDGSNPRTSIDFPQVEASELLVRWTPANATDSINLRELNTFADASVSGYAVAMSPEAIAEYAPEGPEGRIASNSSSDGKSVTDGKTVASADGKTHKEFKNPEAIATGPTGMSPYLPGSLGFPPNINGRIPNIPPPLPPETPVSP